MTKKVTTHTPASKRKNRLKPGPACDTAFGSANNKNQTRKNYGLIRNAYQRLMGKNVFA